ncbi:hypothetical protein PybrP1_001581 [[Pythium] brassicae (nom. inval.)]|nr:hypothetical protein PybrP1_001581 [[Pythium] brassicae (nom. inval.)]
MRVTKIAVFGAFAGALQLGCLCAVVATATGQLPLASSTLPLTAASVASRALQVGAGALALLLALAYVQPRWFMRLVARGTHPSVLWCVSTSANVCSLTIDDAPSATTPLLLDVLQQHGVKATFFVISGHIAGHEDTLARIVREGHTLGNHLTEDRPSWRDELHVFERKLQECDRAIRHFQPDVPPAPTSPAAEGEGDGAETTRLLEPDKASAAPLRWLRPASGWFTSRMREVVAAHGYRICLGSVYPHDAQIRSEVLNSLHLRALTTNGSVIIVHDRAWTVGVLKTALPPLTKKFAFVGLEELLRHGQAAPL